MPAIDRQFDSYRRNRLAGALIVIDEATNETVAAGVIPDAEVETRDGGVSRACGPHRRWRPVREEPASPDLMLDAGSATVQDEVERVLELLRTCGLFPS